jgi:hypothetical protein
MLKVSPHQDADDIRVVQTWDDGGRIVPWNDPKADFRRPAAVQRDLFPFRIKTCHDKEAFDRPQNI